MDNKVTINEDKKWLVSQNLCRDRSIIESFEHKGNATLFISVILFPINYWVTVFILQIFLNS